MDKGQGHNPTPDPGQVKLPPKPGPPQPVPRPKLSPEYEAKVKDGQDNLVQILGDRSINTVEVLVSGVGQVTSDNRNFIIKRV